MTGNITYNQLILNEGEAFDKETGIFTTKVAGTYFMTFALPRYGGFADITIYKNGKPETAVGNYNKDYGTNNLWSWMIKLDINDQVNLGVTRGTCYVTDLQNVVFNGFLIKQKHI